MSKGGNQSKGSASASTQGDPLSITLIPPMLEFMDHLLEVDMKDFFRLAVEFARTHLGIERGAIWIREGDRIRGTAGTDLQGRTTDESGFGKQMDDIWRGLFHEGAHPPRWHRQDNTPIYDWNGREPVPCKHGWVVATPILKRIERVALFTNDAAISGRPCDTHQQELLSLFCSMLGQVLARRENDQLRRQAEQLTQFTLNALDQMVCVLDSQGSIISTNTAWRNAACLSCGSAAGQLCEGADYLAACRQAEASGDTLAGVFLHRFEELRKGQIPSFHMEYPCHTAAAQRWFIVRVARMPEQPPRFVIAHTDITETKQAGLWHEQREAQFRFVLGHLQEVVFQTDAEGRLSYLNPAWTEITQRPIEESLGLRLHELVHPEDRAHCAELTHQVLTGQRAACQHEARFATAAGGYRWMQAHARVIQGSEGAPTGLAGTLSDVTERKQTEHLLEERLQFFGSLFDCALDVISVIDDQGRIIYLNEAVHAVLGYRPEELLGTCVLDLVHPDEQGLAKNELERALAGASDRAALNFRARHQDGTWRVLESTANQLPTAQGQRLILSVRDVTDRHRNEELRVALDRLGEAARTARVLDDLLAAVHRIVGDLIPADSFYVALQDADHGVLRFPYWSDRRDPSPNAHLPANGLTEYVLTSQRPLRLNPENLADFLATSGATIQGTRPLEWVGVPLRAHNRVLGAMVVQSYEPTTQLGAHAQTVLEVLATPLAMALSELAHAEARAESDQHYRTLFTEMPSAFMVVRMVAGSAEEAADGVVVEVNAALERLLNQPRSELVERRFSAILPEHPRPWFSALEEVCRSGQPAAMEWESEWLRRHLVVYAYRSQPGHVACIIEDITQRKSAERELHRRDALLEATAFSAERFLRTSDWEACAHEVLAALGRAADASRVYIFQNETLPSGRLATSQRYEWVAAGVTPQLHNPLLQHCDPETLGVASWFRELAQDHIIAGPAHTFPENEQHLFTAQQVKSILLVPVFAGGHFWGFIGFDECRQDRTWMASEKDALRSAAQTLGEAIQRRAAEEAMRVRSAAVASAANGIVITDATGHIIFVNQSFQNLTGYSEGEVLGHTPSILKSGFHEPAFYQDMWQHMKDGQVWRGEITNRRKDGVLYQEEMTITPVRDPTGKVTHFIAIKQDITERRNLQQQLQQAQKMESIGRLAGGIAHDFNNLLQAITGFSSILMSDLGEGDPRRGDVEEIDRAAQRAVALTRQLLAFSRKQKMELTPLDLNREVLGTEKMLRRLIGENIALSTELAPDLPLVLADAGQLEQVIVNLAVNARDAMPDGGHLVLRTRAVTLSEQEVLNPELAGARPGPHLQLSIIDNGTGMTPEVRERIFEPFFSTKGPGKGTGLGLAVVYGIVRQHGGHIEVRTQPGAGTTMLVYLPVPSPDSLPQVHKPPAPAPVGQVQGKSERVLIVEDEEGVREFAARVLRDHHYQIETAATCAEARALIQHAATPFDLLLSDVVLPDGNGIRLADELTANRPDLPVLLCSAYSEEQARSDVIQSRGYRFLPKPYPMAALLREVRTLLDRKSV